MLLDSSVLLPSRLRKPPRGLWPAVDRQDVMIKIPQKNHSITTEILRDAGMRVVVYRVQVSLQVIEKQLFFYDSLGMMFATTYFR